MNTKDKIKAHENCISLIEAINLYQSWYESNIKGYQNSGYKWQLHNSEIYKKVVTRLQLRYRKQLEIIQL